MKIAALMNMQSIFTKAGLKRVAVENQNGWSADMLAVKI